MPVRWVLGKASLLRLGLNLLDALAAEPADFLTVFNTLGLSMFGLNNAKVS
jgi:hypothetical protein